MGDRKMPEMTFNPGDEVEFELNGAWRRAAIMAVYPGVLTYYNANVECLGSLFLLASVVNIRPFTPKPTIRVGTAKDGWDEAIDANPKDWARRSVYADWLEESGCNWLMEGQRYQVENKKTPGPAYVKEAEVTWFSEVLVNSKWRMHGNKRRTTIKPEWCIPDNLFEKLRNYILFRRDIGWRNLAEYPTWPVIYQYAKSWNSRREAETALALALKQE